MDHRMTRPARLTQAHPAHAALLPERLARTVTWSDFRTAVRYALNRSVSPLLPDSLPNCAWYLNVPLSLIGPATVKPVSRDESIR